MGRFEWEDLFPVCTEEENADSEAGGDDADDASEEGWFVCEEEFGEECEFPFLAAFLGGE